MFHLLTLYSDTQSVSLEVPLKFMNLPMNRSGGLQLYFGPISRILEQALDEDLYRRSTDHGRLMSCIDGHEPRVEGRGY